MSRTARYGRTIIGGSERTGRIPLLASTLALLLVGLAAQPQSVAQTPPAELGLPLTSGPGEFVSVHAGVGAVHFTGKTGWLVVSFCTPEIIRVQAGPTNVPVPPDGILVSRARWRPVHYHLQDLGGRVEITTDALEIDVRKQPLAVDFYTPGSHPLSLEDQGIRWDQRSVSDERTCGQDEHFYGFGLQFYRFDQRGEDRFLKTNADPKTDTGESHVVVPFFLSTAGYGIFLDSTGFTRFGMGSQDPGRLSMQAPDPTLDYYFIKGPAPRDIVSRYTLITGRMRMPPRWGLGFWYRMKSGWPEAKVKETATGFRTHHIPCDVIGLEPSWQTHAYPCSFAWNTTAFPDPPDFVQWLKDNGFRLNLWEHAYTASSSPLYRRLSNARLAADKQVWHGLVPDFSLQRAKDLFTEEQDRQSTSLGVAGYKLDEDDGSDFTGGWFFPDDTHFPSGLSGAQLHNVFGFLYQKAMQELYDQKNLRTFLLSRGGYAGSQAYPVAAYSDSYDLGAYLRALCDSGFTGVLWCPEVRQTQDAAEFARRCELAFFSPVAMINAWADGVTPWEKGPAIEALFRQYDRLRMLLIPYLYSAFWEDHEDGIPVVRPLILDFPDDRATWNIDDEFLLGDSLLVAPVLQGTSRSIYLPPGRWTNYWTGQLMQGGRTFTMNAPLDVEPLFVREGAIIPTSPPADHLPDLEVVSLALYPGTIHSQIQVYNDDGVTTRYLGFEHSVLPVSMDPVETGTGNGALLIHLEGLEGKFPWQQPWIDLEVHGLAVRPAEVRDGTHILAPFGAQPLDTDVDQGFGWWYDPLTRIAHLRVPFGHGHTVRLAGVQLTAPA